MSYRMSDFLHIKARFSPVHLLIVLLIILTIVISSYLYFLKSPYGIKGTYFTNQLWIGDFIKKKVSPQIAFELKDFKEELPNPDKFSAIWKGYLYAPKDGNYKFYLTSDDGSFLYIDRNLIIDNGGFHVPVEKESIVFLKEGIHEVEIRYFQGGGDAVLKFLWKKHPSSKKSVVSSRYLFYEKISLSEAKRYNMVRIVFLVSLSFLLVLTFTEILLLIKSFQKFYKIWTYNVIIITLMLIFSLWTRLYDIEQAEFKLDEAFWCFEALKILSGDYLPLLGQKTSLLLESYNGPLLSYILALSFFFFGPSPLSGSIVMAILSTAGVFILYKTTKIMFQDIKVALIVSLLALTNPYIFFYSRKIWTQDLLLFLIPLLIFIIYHLAEKGESPLLILLCGFITGLSLQAHLLAFALIGIWVVYLLLITPNFKRLFLKIYPLSICGLILGYFPMILSDLIFSNFTNIKALLHLPQLAESQNWDFFIRFKNILIILSNFISGSFLDRAFFDNEIKIPLSLRIFPNALALLFFLSLIIVIIKIMLDLKKQGTLDKENSLFLLGVFIPFFSFLMSSAHLQWHYFVIFYPFSFLIIGASLSNLTKLRKEVYLYTSNESNFTHQRLRFYNVFFISVKIIFYLLLVAGIIYNSAMIFYSLKYINKTGGTGDYGKSLSNKQKAVQFVIDDSHGSYFAYAHITRDYLAYQYLFKIKDPKSIAKFPYIAGYRERTTPIKVYFIHEQGQRVLPGGILIRTKATFKGVIVAEFNDKI